MMHQPEILTKYGPRFYIGDIVAEAVAASAASPATAAAGGAGGECVFLSLPPGTKVLGQWLSLLCMRSKAWLAARMPLRLARLPRAQRSRRLRSTRAAAPGLLAHTEVTKNIIFSERVQNLGNVNWFFVLR